MDWPFNHHSKTRPTVFPVRLWSLAFLTLVFGFLNSSPVVVADSSPPVADVEDLFKDEGFLRMSRGGEAFGRRPPPPPLILNPTHLSTQTPKRRQFPTPLPLPQDKGRLPSAPPQQRNDQISASGEKGSLENVNSNLANRSHNRNRGTKSDVDKVGSDEGGNGGLKPTGLDANGHQSSRGLDKDVNGVFSKVSPAVVNGGTSGGASSSSGDTGAESDAHPLLGITPAAPGEAFDFNPILSNPAVTRILAGSSGRIPQWEPALPDLHDLIPEVNYTTDVLGNRGYPHSHNPQVHQHPSATNDNGHSGSSSGGSGTSYSNNGGFLGGSNGISSSGTNSNSNNLSGNNGHGALFNPKNPVFVPSPVSSKGSSTMYNMDQLTNNIAIPKHTLPNPSNLATSRSTVLEDGSDANSGGGSNNNYGGNNQGNGGGVSGTSSAEDTDRDNGNSHHDRYPPSSGSIGSSNHLEGSRGEGGGPYFYDEDDSGLSEDSARSHVATNSNDAQGKRGIWTETGSGHPGQEPLDSRDENGPKYIVCDALCGAWKHQCKLMGILFSITSVLCLVFAIGILYSLQFSIRDFVPFSIILLLLFTTSASRAFILLSGWLCSPDSRPTWLPIISTLPAALFVITILVALHLARFPFPFIKSYTIPCYMILIISSVALGPPISLSLGAHFHPHNHGLLSQVAWIFGHAVLALMSLAYLLKFKPFYVRLANERGNVNAHGGTSNSTMNGGSSLSNAGGTPAVVANGSSNLSTLKKRGYVVKWGCLQARAMFGASLLALCLSTMIIISVAMGRGECEATSTWTGWVLSLCARMLEFAIVILLLLVTISSADIRFISRLTRVPINKSNVGLINADIFPTMVSSNTAVQRCIPMYSSNTRADVMMLGPTESRSSLRGKTFGERALPGERLGEYRSSVGRGLPLRLGSGGPSHSLPGTPVDGFPQGLKLPEPAPASLLVTKVVFGTPAKSREVNHLSHQHENPLHCTGGGPGSKDDRETNNIYASLESVKIAPFVNAGSSTGSNHSGSDRVLLSAPRDYIYSISRDLTKTIDSIYDTSRPRGNNLAHTIETLCPPLAHTIEQIGSIPNLSSNQPGRGGSSASGAGASFNLHPHNLHHSHGNSMAAGRTDLARTIDRIRYAAAAGAPSASLTAPGNNQAGRNFVLQLGTPGSTHLPGMGNPPPYCSSESSHDVTPDSGIVSDIHSKNGRDVPEVVYAREYRGNSVEDIRRLPMLPLSKHQHRGPGPVTLYDKTPTSPNNPSCAPSPAALRPGNSQLYVPTPTSNNTIVGCVEHLLNQTEHILSRTESLDSNSHSAGLQRLLNHKEQLEHVEKLLAQAEYAIWLEKRNVSQLGSNESPSPYGFSHRPVSNANSVASASFSSANSANPVQSSMRKETPNNPLSSGSSGNPMIVNNHGSSISSGGAPSIGQSSKKISKKLEEESVV